MDATFTLGPITFSLLGFSIVVTLNDGVTLDHLQKAISDVGFTLDGLSFAFNKPPLLIAGGFEHEIIVTGTEKQDIYLGGVGVSFPPYTFVGIGEYATVELPVGSGNSYKSVFLFAKLDGPLIELELATISGVRLGLGYNSLVRSPTIDELTSFPFIQDTSIAGTGNDPMALLKKLVDAPDASTPAWVSPKIDSYWFAAGMSVTAFELLTVTAVVMLGFRDSGLVASIYADAVAMMPPDVPKEAVLVYAEIAMMAEMNFIDGYFRVEAALAPTSYLLVPQCKIYGGFAMCYWFPPSDHTGDFVFSIGGYHRSYTPPPWYPVPQRLGISFNIDIISITGEAYFAVTPKCAMGGAMIHASLGFGPISAWLDATFDALVQFHPLHYSINFSVSIGVTFDADILFIHIHISASVGADLHIEGPEFGGTAHVDFYLFGFTVDFGASPQPPPPLDLFQFWDMLHTAGPAPGSADTTKVHDSPVRSFLTYDFVSQDPDHASSPQNLGAAALKYVLVNGNYSMPAKQDDSSATPTSTGAGAKWYVKGGSFQFQIASDVALSDATIALGQESIQELIDNAKANHKDPPQPPYLRSIGPSENTIYSKPMHASTEITSTLAVTVTFTETGEVIDRWDQVTLVDKDVPTAIWEKYDGNADPSKTPQSLLNGKKCYGQAKYGTLVDGASPELCPPADASGFIPKFNATAASRLEIRDFRVDTNNGTAWIMKPSEALQVNDLPKELTDKERSESNQQRWNETRTTWKGLTSKSTVVNDKTNGLLALFATTLAWDQKRPQTKSAGTAAATTSTSGAATAPSGSTGPVSGTSPAPVKVSSAPRAPSRQPWELVGDLPLKMIDNLAGTYLDLPRWAVVGA